VKVHLLSADGQSLRQGGPELLNEKGVRWIDIEGDAAADLELLREPYGLHRLAIEDCLHLDQRPKLEEYPGHVFLVVQGFSARGKDLGALTLHELDFFLGPDWVITVHDADLPVIQALHDRVRQEPARTLGKGPDYLAYLFADALVDSHFPLMDLFTEQVECLEEEVFDRPRQEQLRQSFTLRKSLVTLRRVLSPQRDVIGLLARRGIPHVSERTSLYFRDVYDHLVRLYEQIEANRDFLGSTMEGYLSMVANKTNEISKQLTVFATIFLPLSFITGFFGQNFDILSRPVFFWLMMVSVVGLPVGLMFWFRSKEWL
jgi:magnesium transporter